MKATKPGPEANRNQATSDRATDEGVSGGGLVDEEDIGTEGAGTEPRTTVDDADRAIDSSDDAQAKMKADLLVHGRHQQGRSARRRRTTPVLLSAQAASWPKSRWTAAMCQ